MSLLLPASLLVEPYGRVLLYKVQIYLVAEQLADVGDAVLDHGRPLQTQAKAVYHHVWGQAHGLEHLGAEDAAVADLDELVELLVVAEDLHARLGVGVVAR